MRYLMLATAAALTLSATAAQAKITFDEETADYIAKRFGVKGCTIKGSKSEADAFTFQCTDGRVFLLTQDDKRVYLKRFNSVTAKFEFVKP
jgi:hypothetical protein